jgi:hypothetical protein
LVVVQILGVAAHANEIALTCSCIINCFSRLLAVMIFLLDLSSLFLIHEQDINTHLQFPRTSKVAVPFGDLHLVSNQSPPRRKHGILNLTGHKSQLGIEGLLDSTVHQPFCHLHTIHFKLFIMVKQQRQKRAQMVYRLMTNPNHIPIYTPMICVLPQMLSIIPANGLGSKELDKLFVCEMRYIQRPACIILGRQM